MTKRPGLLLVVVALGALEGGLLASLGWLPAAGAFPAPGLIVFGLAFTAYAIAAWWVGRESGNAPSRPDDHPDSSAEPWEADSVLIAAVWAMGLLMRLALFPLAPELSDDVWRYLWDGHVQLAGTNPYLHAPGAAEVEGLRTAWHASVNNPDVPTIYPPFAQMAFVVIGVLGSSVSAAKALWLACDVATGLVLARVARETGRNQALVLLLYLWAPLLVIEVAWSAHLEPLGLLMLSLAILWSHRADRSTRPEPATRVSSGGTTSRVAAFASGAALALSALTKFAPAAAAPALFRRHGVKTAGAFAAAVVVFYLPYVAAGDALFTGLRTYSEHWWFMKGPFAVLEAVAGDPAVARRLAAGIVVGVVAWTVYARFDLERALLWTLGTGMILTPTLHPWYVLWMLPMAALRRARPWIGLSGLAFLGYFGLDAFRTTGVWIQPGWVRAALWLPFLALLVHDARRGRETPGVPEAEPS